MPKLALVLFDDAGRTGEGAGPYQPRRPRLGRRRQVGEPRSARARRRGGDLPPMVSATERLARWLSRRP